MDAKNMIASIKKVVQEKPNLYDQYTVPLSLAAIDALVAITGDFLYVMDAPASLNASVKFNDSKHDGLTLKKGRKYAVPFAKFMLTIGAGQMGTMTLLIGKDAAFDFADMGVVNIDTINQPVKQQAANNMNVAGSPVTVDTTAGGKLVIAANASRQSVTVVVEGANPVRFGASGVTFAGGAAAAGGVLLQPGQSYTFYHTAAIYGICNAALTSNVGFEEEYNT
jgi:hypothetical protein